MMHNTAPRWGLRRSTPLLAIFLMSMFGLVGVPAGAVTADDCVPGDGTPAVFSAWATVGFTDWQLENTPPADPDDETGADNPANLRKWGSAETQQVGNNDGTPDSYTDWVIEGGQIMTEENNPPGADSDLVRYLFVGETEPQVITPGVAGGHYSWTGGNRGVGDPPTTFPPDDADNWQKNAATEPPGHLNGATWFGTPGVGLHVLGNSPSNASWFYTVLPVPEVTDIDYLWQKQVRELVPGSEETFHTEYRWPLLARTYTPGEAPVECPSEPPANEGDDSGSPGPKGDTGTPPVQVAGAQAAVTTTPPAQVPTNVAAGLGETVPTRSSASPLGLLMVLLGALITAAALRHRARV